MKVLEAQADRHGMATLVDVVERLEKAQDTYKVTTTSQLASLEQGSINPRRRTRARRNICNKHKI